MQRARMGYKRASAVVAVVVAGCTGTAEESAVRQPWQQRAPLPEGRTEVSVTTDGQLVYLLGGFGQGSGQQASAPRTLYSYDPATDQWSSPGAIPEGVNHAGLVHLNGKLYLIGGFRENTFTPSGAVRIYDPATRTWTEGAPLPTPRGALATVVLAGRIHAIGGNAANASSLDHRDHGVGSDASSVGTHEVYDPASNTWTRHAPLPTPRNHLGAAVVNGKIHVVAGRVGGTFTMTTHEIYDAATDSWTTAPPVPTGRSGIAVVEHRGQVYVFGGETSGQVSKTFAEAERFDPRTNAWESLPPLPTARHGLGAAAVGSVIYVISGGPQPGFAFSGANEMLTPPDPRL
jgi:N-acetylneuraminic acid mutarotase